MEVAVFLLYFLLLVVVEVAVFLVEVVLAVFQLCYLSSPCY